MSNGNRFQWIIGIIVGVVVIGLGTYVLHDVRIIKKTCFVLLDKDSLRAAEIKTIKKTIKELVRELIPEKEGKYKDLLAKTELDNIPEVATPNMSLWGVSNYVKCGRYMKPDDDYTQALRYDVELLSKEIEEIRTKLESLKLESFNASTLDSKE